jgi:Flp pilus assembly protein TadB
MKRGTDAPTQPDIQAGLQWGIGCLVGGAALVGALILVLLVSIAVQPPAWVQIVLGVALVGGAISLSWLFTSALRRSQQASSRPHPQGVEPLDRGRGSGGTPPKG